MKTKSVAGVIAALALGAIPFIHSPGTASANGYVYHDACSLVTVGWARCNSIVRFIPNNPASSEATGYGPIDLQAAYHLPSAKAGKGQTVAIVDAFDDPNAESDLAVYRATYGLPACTTANGCFKKVDQTGGTHYPKTDPTGGWEAEESLDLAMVSAICPNCNILLVEATNNSNANLGTAVNEAAKLGASAISNSYGGPEAKAELQWDTKYYKHSGVAITASSGDGGFGTSYPAASQYVTAVGGTSLTRSHNGNGWGEIAWSGAGSGCSKYEPKPSWQHDPSCSMRTIADVSAVADPNTGVAVYDTFPLSGVPAGWLVFGGTSVSSPIIASVYALAGNTGSILYGSYSYFHTNNVFDIVEGYNNANGNPGCNFPSYLCTSVPGYDGPTGNGTPNGTGAF